MDNLFIYLINLVILAIVVVLIYLVDKVNAIEGRGTVGELASQAAALITSGPSLDNGFNGLSGKKLWDTACGKAEPPLDTPELESFRKRYEPILNKHILGLIEDGGHDAVAVPLVLGGDQARVVALTVVVIPIAQRLDHLGPLLLLPPRLLVRLRPR
ncbi:MAG: hypothetical protein QMB88_00125, partial [Burkholderiaceae bacterium]